MAAWNALISILLLVKCFSGVGVTFIYLHKSVKVDQLKYVGLDIDQLVAYNRLKFFRKQAANCSIVMK